VVAGLPKGPHETTLIWVNVAEGALGGGMSVSSWVGSVWSLRGVEGPVIGQVRGVDGEVLTMVVVGLGGEPPEGVELGPAADGGRPLARLTSDTLVGRWKRMGGSPT
jgi:hypothetical protein